jgi:DNA primase
MPREDGACSTGAACPLAAGVAVAVEAEENGRRGRKQMGIRSIRKTSSATGVQIYVPIVRGYTFEQLRMIGHFVGSYVVQKHPQRKTWQKRQERRKWQKRALKE